MPGTDGNGIATSHHYPKRKRGPRLSRTSSSLTLRITVADLLERAVLPQVKKRTATDSVRKPPPAPHSGVGVFLFAVVLAFRATFW